MSKTLMEQVEETAALVESVLAENGFQIHEDVDTVEGFMSVIEDVLEENDLGEEAEDQLCYAYAMLESSLSSEELDEADEADPEVDAALGKLEAPPKRTPEQARQWNAGRLLKKQADAAELAKKNPADKSAQDRAAGYQKLLAAQKAKQVKSVALNARQESVESAPVSYRITRTVE